MSQCFLVRKEGILLYGSFFVITVSIINNYYFLLKYIYLLYKVNLFSLFIIYFNMNSNQQIFSMLNYARGEFYNKNYENSIQSYDNLVHYIESVLPTLSPSDQMEMRTALETYKSEVSYVKGEYKRIVGHSSNADVPESQQEVSPVVPSEECIASSVPSEECKQQKSSEVPENTQKQEEKNETIDNTPFVTKQENVSETIDNKSTPLLKPLPNPLEEKTHINNKTREDLEQLKMKTIALVQLGLENSKKMDKQYHISEKINEFGDKIIKFDDEHHVSQSIVNGLQKALLVTLKALSKMMRAIANSFDNNKSAKIDRITTPKTSIDCNDNNSDMSSFQKPIQLDSSNAGNQPLYIFPSQDPSSKCPPPLPKKPTNN
ncbi:hypothetical protein WA158_007477 [Blastocystis sp. Blastoise]